jgi:hypothetical protein
LNIGTPIEQKGVEVANGRGLCCYLRVLALRYDLVDTATAEIFKRGKSKLRSHAGRHSILSAYIETQVLIITIIMNTIGAKPSAL